VPNLQAVVFAWFGTREMRYLSSKHSIFGDAYEKTRARLIFFSIQHGDKEMKTLFAFFLVMVVGNVWAVNALYPTTVFAPTSFWYQPIPAEVPLNPNTVAYTQEFLRQLSRYYGTVAINTVSYASPVYIVGPGTPTVPMQFFDCQHKGYFDGQLKAQWSAVPIPDFAAASDGLDQEMSIYQPSTNSYFEFWKAQIDLITGQWEACWGGGMKNVSTSNGIWQRGYGATATGLPFIGGQITADELLRGQINHVMGISLVDTEKFGIFSWPALRSDGYNPTNVPNRIPEGLRFRLDPAVDVETLPMSSRGKVIARAAQKYGFVVWDKAGAISLRAENVKTYTQLGGINPYPTILENQATYDVLNGMPWDRLQFLPMDYGKP
jgi:hypothetical protein